MIAERAYLSIVAWPEGWGPDRCVEALVAAAGTDPGQARLAVARGVPRVVQLVDASVAPEILEALHAEGVLALAPTEGDIRRAPAPERVKRFHLFEGGGSLAVEFWRAEACVVPTPDLRLLVRGTIRPREAHRAMLDPDPLHESLRPIARRLHVDLTDAPGPAPTGPGASELLDLHLAGGRVLRVDADKMSFDVLGEARGAADRVNMEKLTTLLASLGADARLDGGFARFGRVDGMARPAGSSARTLAFDFYSAWCGAVHRALGVL